MDVNEQQFEEMIAKAVVQAHFLYPSNDSTVSVVDADVEINKDEKYDPTALLEKYQSGDDLTPEEIGVLVTAAGSEGLDLESLADQSTADGLQGTVVEVASEQESD